jgi:hypothetical protein
MNTRTATLTIAATIVASITVAGPANAARTPDHTTEQVTQVAPGRPTAHRTVTYRHGKRTVTLHVKAPRPRAARPAVLPFTRGTF